MPSAFSWPMLVPSSLRLPAPVNLGVRLLAAIRTIGHNRMAMNIKSKAKQLAEQARLSGSKAVENTISVARKIDSNHEKISDHADTIAKATKVAAGISVAGAVVAAPTGLTALGVTLGVLSAPAIVTAAPILASAAGIAVTVSAGASLYSKARRKKKSQERT